MKPESNSKSKQLMKRDRPESSSPSESPLKKRKSAAKTPRKDSLRLGPPVALISLSHAEPTKDDLKGQTIKPSPHKSDISIRTTSIKPSPLLPGKGIKPDPQPICSDLFYPSTTNKRTKPSPIIDLTGNTSDEQSDDSKSDVNLQRQLDERTSEVKDYRDSLHNANSKIQKLQRNELLRKAAEQVDLEKRKEEIVKLDTALQNAKEKSDQLVKANSELEKQVEEQKVTISRLQTEKAELEEESEDQKHAADWYKAKFLKFKAAYNELKREMEEKAGLLRRILPAIFSVAGMPSDQTRPVEDVIIVTDKVEAENGSPAENTSDGPLVPAREDEVNGEAQDNAAQ